VCVAGDCAGGRALSAASVLVPWSEVSSASLRLCTFLVGVLAVRCWGTDVRLKGHFLLLAVLGENTGSMKVARMRWRLVSRSLTRGGGGEEEEASMRRTSSMQERNSTQSSTVQQVMVCCERVVFVGGLAKVSDPLLFNAFRPPAIQRWPLLK